MPEASHEIQGRRITRKYGILAIVLVIIIVIIALVTWFGVNAANREAKSYETAFDSWNGQTKADLIKTTSTLPKNLYVFDDQSSKKNLATQKKGCDQIEQTLGKVTDAAKKAPKLKASMFGGLSGSYGDAKKHATTRSKTVQAYLDAAEKTYQQVLTDCRWNIKVNTAAVESQKLYDEADKLDQNYHEQQGGSICNNKGGCLPENDGQRKKYLSTFRRATESAIDKILPQLAPDQCGRTSLSVSCQKLHDGYKAVFNADIHYVDVTSKLTSAIHNSKIDAALKVYDKADAALSKAMLAAFKKQYPDFTVSKELKKDAETSDRWLDAVAHGRIHELVGEQADIKKL